MDLPARTPVIPHDETMRMLAYSGLTENGLLNEEKASQLSSHFQLLRRDVRELNQTIKNKRETHINMTPEGVAMAYKYAQTYHHFMNTTYR